MTRNTWTTAVILAGALIMPAAAWASGSGVGGDTKQHTAPAARAPQQPQLVSITTSPGTGRHEVMYSVPRNSRLLVTNACIQHDAMSIAIGDDGDNLSYGASGCTYYNPGFAVAGGEDIYCENRSGLERTCALVGMLEELPRQTGRRVQILDLHR